MRDTLFPFQETALSDLHEKITQAHTMWNERNPQVISFAAPTGSGKTIKSFRDEYWISFLHLSYEP